MRSTLSHTSIRDSNGCSYAVASTRASLLRGRLLLLSESITWVGILKGKLKILVCLILEQLSILESVNELHFFAFHALNLKFSLSLILGLSRQFFTHKLLSAHLASDEVFISLASCVVLLPLDHVLFLTGSHLLLVPLVLVGHLEHDLLTLGFVRLSLRARHRHMLRVGHVRTSLVLVSQIHLTAALLVLPHLILSGHLVLHVRVVAIPLVHDFAGTLPRLINLLDNLSIVKK